MNKVELLSPAGDMNKLKTAFNFGADAVYIGGKSMSLRALAGNFTDEEILEAVEFAHNLGKKVYVTVNIFGRNDDIEHGHTLPSDRSSDTDKPGFRRSFPLSPCGD